MAVKGLNCGFTCHFAEGKGGFGRFDRGISLFNLPPGSRSEGPLGAGERAMDRLHTGGTMGGLIISAITRFGDRPAIADGTTQWTYRELGDAVARFISVFRALGLTQGSAVSVLASNRVESWAAICATLVMGARYTSLHPLAAEDDQAFIVEDAEIDLLIVEAGKFSERGRAIRQRVPGLKHLASFGAMNGAMDGARDILADVATAAPAPLVDEGENGAIAFLAYTGGTTGRSKGVMLPHRSLVAMTVALFADWDWPAEIRFLAATPISHAAGVTLFPVMLRGGYSRLVQGFDPEVYGQVVQDDRITATFLVPTLIYALIDNEDLRRRVDLSSLDMIIYGAAPMSPDRLREAIRIFGRVFVQLYGQTEAPQCITTLRKIDHDPRFPRRLGSCGRPNALVEEIGRASCRERV